MKKNLHLQLIYLCVLILNVSLYNSLSAQTIDFLTESTVSYSQLTTQQKSIYDTVNAHLDSGSHIYFVHIDSLSDPKNEGFLRIKLSFLPCPEVTFRVSFCKYHNDTDYTYSGILMDSTDIDFVPEDTLFYKEDSSLKNCSSGSLSIVAMDNKKYGALIIGSDKYSIIDLTGDIQIIYKLRPVNSWCGLSTKEENSIIDTTTVRTEGGCQSHALRILVLYTDAAQVKAQQLGITPAAQAALSLTSMQGAWNNSNIGGAYNSYIVGVLPFTFHEGSDMANDLNIFYNNNQATLEALRANPNYHADIIVLLTNGNYGNTIGMAFSNYQIPTSNHAYAMVQIANAPQYTFAHEIGHLLGALHDPDNDLIDPSGYAHGHIFYYKKWNLWCLCYKYYYNRTIMAYSDGYNAPQVQHFSNPNVNYGSHHLATGIANKADNARKLNETQSIVRDYFTETIPFYIDLTVNDVEPCHHSVYANVDVSCGTPPYTYQWYKSNNGMTFTVIPGAISSGIMLPVISHSNYPVTGFLKVIVTDANNLVLTQIGSYLVPICGGGQKLGSLENESDNKKVSIYPNPSNGIYELSISSSENDLLEYEVYNSLGQKIIDTQIEHLSVGINSFYLDLAKFKGGYYIISVKTSQIFQNYSLLKLK